MSVFVGFIIGGMIAMILLGYPAAWILRRMLRISRPQSLVAGIIIVGIADGWAMTSGNMAHDSAAYLALSISAVITFFWMIRDKQRSDENAVTVP